jgi:hypothetical protein
LVGLKPAIPAQQTKLAKVIPALYATCRLNPVPACEASRLYLAERGYLANVQLKTPISGPGLTSSATFIPGISHSVGNLGNKRRAVKSLTMIFAICSILAIYFMIFMILFATSFLLFMTVRSLRGRDCLCYFFCGELC